MSAVIPPRRRALPTLLALVVLAGVLPGCLFGRSAGAPPAGPGTTPAAPTTRPAAVVLRGTPDMNQSNAVVVRVYTLRGASALPQASLPALWADDAAALRGDLVGREELRLFPGESQTVALDLGAEVTHVAVVANLRAPDDGGWMHVFPADELWGQEAVVIIGADRLVVTGE